MPEAAAASGRVMVVAPLGGEAGEGTGAGGGGGRGGRGGVGGEGRPVRGGGGAAGGVWVGGPLGGGAGKGRVWGGVGERPVDQLRGLDQSASLAALVQVRESERAGVGRRVATARAR